MNSTMSELAHNMSGLDLTLIIDVLGVPRGQILSQIWTQHAWFSVCENNSQKNASIHRLQKFEYMRKNLISELHNSYVRIKPC